VRKCLIFREAYSQAKLGDNQGVDVKQEDNERNYYSKVTQHVNEQPDVEVWKSIPERLFDGKEMTTEINLQKNTNLGILREDEASREKISEQSCSEMTSVQSKLFLHCFWQHLFYLEIKKGPK
jgi:hypothetical protein